MSVFFKFGFGVIFEMEKIGKNRKLGCGGKGEDGKNWKKELKNGKFSRQYKNRENKLRKDKRGGKR